MGFISRDNAVEAYKRIKQAAIGHVCSILILAAPSLDSICALKILTSLFKSDFLPFKVVPVAGYDDIVAANDNFLQGRNEISTIILLDCGGMVDLGEFLSLSPQMTVYIFDSHRPYSLVNIFGNSQLNIIDDGSIGAGLDDLKQAYEGTKIRRDEINSDDDEDEDDLSSIDDENDEPNRRRSSKREEKMYKRECYQKMLLHYRYGSYYGASVSHMIYEIADQLAKSNNDHLWCAILGVTYQHLLELCPEEVYHRDFEYLRDACLRENPTSSANGRPSNALEHLDTNRDGQIKQEDEFRFMLMRHWSLFNSMFHSRYVATRLKVWREKGRRLLETFIVKMGIPLYECTRDYSSMDQAYKESLSTRLAKHANDFGIHEVVFSSFSRNYGYVLRLSASDAVYALMALVEAPHPEDFALIEDPSGTRERIWVKNFYSAFDALDFHHTDKLKRGIQLAMKQHQVCLQEATKIISHRLVRTGRRFRYIILRHSPDLAWLSSHPLSLSKLALFIVDAQKETKKAALPLVLAAFQPASQLYQVVAINGSREPRPQGHPDEIEEDPLEFRNHFGMCFRQAAALVRARVKHDGFQSSVIEVNADDLKAFIHTLQTIPSPREDLAY